MARPLGSFVFCSTSPRAVSRERRREIQRGRIEIQGRLETQTEREAGKGLGRTLSHKYKN